MTVGARRGEPLALPADAQLFFELARLVNLTARPFAQRVGRPHDLTLPEWRIMVALAREPGIVASEAAQRTGLDKMTVSRALAKLERAGRVVRHDDAHDRRRSPVELTAAGRRLFATVIEAGRGRADRLFGVLSADEIAALSRMVERMVETLLADGEGDDEDDASGGAAAGPAPTIRTKRRTK